MLPDPLKAPRKAVVAGHVAGAAISTVNASICFWHGVQLGLVFWLTCACIYTGLLLVRLSRNMF